MQMAAPVNCAWIVAVALLVESAKIVCVPLTTAVGAGLMVMVCELARAAALAGQSLIAV